MSDSEADDVVSDQQRLAEAAMLRTLRDLRRSIEAGRPMTLQNCLRLCKRRMAALSVESAYRRPRVDRLASLYRAIQPFRSGLALQSARFDAGYAWSRCYWPRRQPKCQ